MDWIDFDATVYERIEAGELVEMPAPEILPHWWNYPNIDPYQHGEPDWLLCGMRILAILGPALVANAKASQKPYCLHRDITDAVLVIIPRLIEAAFAAGDIPHGHLVERLLRSCGYDGFADRVARAQKNALIPPKGLRNDKN